MFSRTPNNFLIPLYDSFHTPLLSLWCFYTSPLKAGKAPPRKVIEQWIVDKGIISDISTKSLAFLIQRKIAREGTTIAQQGGSDLVSGILTDKLLGEIKSDLILLFTGIVVREMKSTITGISR